MDTTLRQRRTPRRPSTLRYDSCPSLDYSISSSSTSSSRPRSHSLYEHTNNRKTSIHVGSSSLLQSLDLPASLLTLREFLTRKLEDAERGLRALQEYVEDGEAEEELLHLNEEVPLEEEDEEEDEAEEEDEPRDHEEIPSAEGEHEPLNRRRQKSNDVDAEITALEQFIQNASRFLAAMRNELPTLATDSTLPSSSSSLLTFQLSDEARTTLDQFLEDHPLPSFPHFSTAASSANALLLRVTTELRTLKDALSYLTTTASTDSTRASSFRSPFRSLPPMPSPMPDFTELRSYFSTESNRIRGAARHFKDETTESFQAGLHHLSDGAAEISAYVKDHSVQAFDEAKKMYHLALEIGKTRLLRYEELPHEWRNNEFIITDYRYIPIEQWGTLLKSGWQWHNETVNIQSHFLGFLSLVFLLVYYLSTPTAIPSSSSSTTNALSEAAAHPGDTAIAVLFVAAGMKCLLSSAAWHLLAGCATSSWFQGAACLDYVGISGLIAASVMAAEYYGFYDQSNLAMSYMIFSSVVGITGMIVPWSAWFNQREYKAYRIAFFVALAASAIAPVTHRAVLYGFFDTLSFYSPAIPSVGAYLVGLIFYAHQFPECCSPGSWNWGSSHNLWHIAIVIAVWLQWRALQIWSTLVHS